MEQKRNDICKNCKWFKKADSIWNPTSTCCCTSPAIGWPVVSENDFCGEFYHIDNEPYLK